MNKGHSLWYPVFRKTMYGSACLITILKKKCHHDWVQQSIRTLGYLTKTLQKDNESSSFCVSFGLVPLSQNQTHWLSSSTTWKGLYLPGNGLLNVKFGPVYYLCRNAYPDFSTLVGLAFLLFSKHAGHILTSEPLHSLFYLPGMFLPHVSTWPAPPSIVFPQILPLSGSSLSMSSTQRPPGTHLQWSTLDLWLVAVKENTDHGACGLLRIGMSERAHRAWA